MNDMSVECLTFQVITFSLGEPVNLITLDWMGAFHICRFASQLLNPMSETSAE